MKHLQLLIAFFLISLNTTILAEDQAPTRSEILKLLREKDTEQFEAYCKQYPKEIFVYALNNPTISKSFYNIYGCPYYELLPLQFTMAIDAENISLFEIKPLSPNISVCLFNWNTPGAGNHGIIATYRNAGRFIDAILLYDIIEESYIADYIIERSNNINHDDYFMISSKYHSKYNITTDSILVNRTIRYNILKLESKEEYFNSYKDYLMCDEDFSYYFTPDGKFHLKNITLNENDFDKISNDFYISQPFNDIYTFSDLMRDFSFRQLKFLPYTTFPSKTNILRLIKYNEIGLINFFTIRNPEKMFRLIMSDHEIADGVCKNWIDNTTLGYSRNYLNDVIETITDKQFKQQVIEFLTNRGITLSEEK